MPQYDDHDDLAALDFSADRSTSDDYVVDDSDALNFSVAGDSVDESATDAFDDFTPTETEDAETELEALAAAAEATDEEESEEDDPSLFTVTNPPDTVSVSAYMDGRTQQVTLSPKVTNMTESALAEEIVVLADLARQKGLAGQHTYLMESMSEVEGMEELNEIGLDGSEVLRNFMDSGMQLSTPEEAAAAQAEVFATRYATDK
jgi:hypothetical protein